jgi:sulfonate transport system permease protein
VTDRNSYLNRFLPWLVPCCAVALWQACSSLDIISSRTFPAPSQVLTVAFNMTRSGEIFRHLAVSTARAAAGFLVGGLAGFVLGLLNGVSDTSARLLNTTLQMIRNIPHLALIPLVILWFGIEESSKLFLISLGVFFPVYLNTYHGIRTVDPGLIEMGRAYGLDNSRIFRDILLPGALPAILVGVRYALGIMWLTLIVAETVSASSGIGYMTMNAREFMQTDVIVFGILLYALLGKVADSATVYLERKFLAWHPAFGEAAA